MLITDAPFNIVNVESGQGTSMLFGGSIHNEWQSVAPLVFKFVCGKIGNQIKDIVRGL